MTIEELKEKINHIEEDYYGVAYSCLYHEHNTSLHYNTYLISAWRNGFAGRYRGRKCEKNFVCFGHPKELFKTPHEAQINALLRESDTQNLNIKFLKQNIKSKEKDVKNHLVRASKILQEKERIFKPGDENV